MMDHDELPKGKVPDLLQDEEIPARYTLKGPPTGQVLGVSSLTLHNYEIQICIHSYIPNSC